MMKAAIAPENLFWTPSSRSIISSARFSASSLIEASGWWMRAMSSLMLGESTRHGQELDLEVQGRIRRDHATPRAALAIGRGGRTNELRLAAWLHHLHALRPAADDAVERKFRRLAALVGAVELAAVRESPAVVDADFVGGLGRFALAGLQGLEHDAARRGDRVRMCAGNSEQYGAGSEGRNAHGEYSG